MAATFTTELGELPHPVRPDRRLIVKGCGVVGIASIAPAAVMLWPVASAGGSSLELPDRLDTAADEKEETDGQVAYRPD